jgi:LPXTG-motif cell wall-anchored protein
LSSLSKRKTPTTDAPSGKAGGCRRNDCGSRRRSKNLRGSAADDADNGGTITNGKLPQTGDSTPLALLAALMGASAVALMLLCKRRKA